jgi:hypothetical protein
MIAKLIEKAMNYLLDALDDDGLAPGTKLALRKAYGCLTSMKALNVLHGDDE